MGAACADMMSGLGLPENVKCVISDCAYRDVPSIFRKQLKDWFSIPDIGIVPSASFWLQLRGGYNIYDADTAALVAKSSLPTLFIHGTEDKFVPPADAQVLYETPEQDRFDVVFDVSILNPDGEFEDDADG